MRRILTYQDPFELQSNKELWDLLTNHPQFCASDTLVQGMTAFYDRKNFSVIRPIQDLIDIFFKEYVKNPIQDMNLYLTVSDYIRSWDESPVKQAFLFNKADIINALQLIIPLKCETSKFDKANLSEEQRLFLDIFDNIKSKNCLSSFELLDELMFEDYKEAVQESGIREAQYILKSTTLGDNELLHIDPEAINSVESAKSICEKLLTYYKKKQDEDFFADYSSTIDRIKAIVNQFESKDDIFYRTVTIHGVNQITPIMYYLFNVLEKLGITVVFVIHYATNLPAVFNTWKTIYDGFDTKFEYALPLNLEKSTQFGQKMAAVMSGKKLTPAEKDACKVIKYYRYDNLTSFAIHEASKIYDEAKAEGGPAGQTLKKMSKQYYAVSAQKVNELLQMYHPEQFKEKPFLSYPIGQLILGLYQMWNFETGQIEFSSKCLNECASSGVFKSNVNIQELIRKTQLFFTGISTYEEYKTRIGLLRKEKKLSDKDGVYSGYDRISFFSLSEADIDAFEKYIDDVNKLANSIFDKMDEKIDYVKHFKQLMDEISSHYMSQDALSESEAELIAQIRERLSTAASTSVNGNAKDVQDAIGFFLSAKKTKDTSNWIIRGFEQIDGAVLLSRKSNNGRNNTSANTFHYALVSNDAMLSKKDDELPWPLNEEMFCEYMEVSNALSVVLNGQREHRNFLKYSLFLGTFFCKKNIEFSYIGEIDSKNQSPYYLFETLGIVEIKADEETTPGFIFREIRETTKSLSYSPSKHDKQLFSVCPFKFLLSKVLDSDVYYTSEFQIKYYLSFLVVTIVKARSKNALDRIALLDEEMNRINELIPFLGPIVLSDIYDSAKNDLQNSFINDDEYIWKKSNFLLAKWDDPNGKKLDFNRASDQQVRNYLSENRIYPTTDELPPTVVCDNCNFSALCLRNYYDANAEIEGVET